MLELCKSQCAHSDSAEHDNVINYSPLSGSTVTKLNLTGLTWHQSSTPAQGLRAINGAPRNSKQQHSTPAGAHARWVDALMCFCILSAVFVYFPLSQIMFWRLITMPLAFTMQTKEALKPKTHTHTHRSHVQIFQAPSGITWHPARALAPVRRAWFELFGCCRGLVTQRWCCFFAAASGRTMAWMRRTWN